jgi:myo-inositol-1-phosphate synthase
LKDALVRETAQKGASLNDVAVGLLAEAFGVAYRPAGRKSALPGSSPVILLRMPEELKDAIRAEAARTGDTFNDLVLRTLAAELEIPFKSNRRKEAMANTNGSPNGRARSHEKVRVAIVGVGNCANSLLQGVEYYKDASPEDSVPGLMHVDLGGYHIRDIEFVAAFDVVKGKVGVDLADAIWAHPNDTIKFSEVPKTGLKVSRGMTHDGIGKYLAEVVEKAPGETDDVVGILKERNVDVVVNYLPVGSEEATKWYTEQILNAGCAMVNCMPVFIGREKYWSDRFKKAGVPIIGDDIKSQVGATITHRVLMGIFRDRGVKVDRTFQLNFGGNSDFLNMLERERLESKKISKTYSIQSTVPYEIEDKNIHVGPSDHVPWLEDRKWAYIRLEGTAFGDVPLNAELKIEVWDSPNSAGVVIDAVRLTKLALNNGITGTLEGPSAYLMKSPPVQYTDDAARELVEDFITQNARSAAKAPAAEQVETTS